jgi:hypothetical protein
MKKNDHKIIIIISIIILVLVFIIFGIKFVLSNKELYNGENISENINNVFLYWEGDIQKNRLEILKMSILSIKHFNPDKIIYIFSNTLTDKMLDNICYIIKYDFDSLIKDTPIQNRPKVQEAYRKEINNPRLFSDFFRFVVLYKYGGTYTDTDNLCFRPFPKETNIICRTYDPHTAFYDKIPDKDCVNGKYKYNKQFTNINFGIRNDCWINMRPKNKFIETLLNHKDLIDKQQRVLYIYNNSSWQGLLLKEIAKNTTEISKENKFGLNLIYLYEKFIANSSSWDKCNNGGEMCELYDKLPNIKKYDWGEYKTDKNTTFNFLEKIKQKFPTSCFLWLGDKEGNTELFENKNSLKRMSSWIYLDLKNKIYK